MTSSLAALVAVMADALEVDLSAQIEALTGADRDDEQISRASQFGDTTRLARSATYPSLFAYQSELVGLMVREATLGRDALLSLPTGGGKTRTAAVASLELLTTPEFVRIVWLAPTMELTDQAIATLETMWLSFGRAPDIDLRRAYTTESTRSVWVTTPQAVYQRVIRKKSLGRCDLIVFDEAHQAVARTYSSVLAAAKNSPKNARTPAAIGLSATPGRSNEAEATWLPELFDYNLLTSRSLGVNPVKTLQRHGILSRLSFRAIESQQPADDELSRIILATEIVLKLAESGHRILIFTQTVAGAILFAALLRKHGAAADAVHSSMSTKRRIGAVSDFSGFRTQILTNQRLLATGYDCPAVTDVFLMSRITSPILFEQMVGRAARGPETGGTSNSTIWEFDDHLTLHGRPSSYYRYSEYFTRTATE